MAAFYVKSGAGALDYNAANAYSTGNKMVPSLADATANVAASRKWVWECTTGGTTNGAITWSAAPVQDVTTITQNGVVFTARKPGFSSGSTANWAFATPYLLYGCQAVTAVGDIVYVSNNHAETQTAAYGAGNLSTAFLVVCGDDAAAPPTTAASTATVTTTGNSTITFGTNSANAPYFCGIKFIAGSGASGTASIVCAGATWENCQFTLASTGTSSVISITSPNYWINCDIKFAATAHVISQAGILKWTGGTLLSGGTSPTKLVTNGTSAATLIEGVDLSNASAGINMTGEQAVGFVQFRMRNCKLPSSWSGSLNSTSPGAFWNYEWALGYSMMNCDATGTDYRLTTNTIGGAVTQETTLVKTGGASDGVTPLAWKMVASASTANIFKVSQLTSPEMVLWNSTTGSSITVTVDILRDSAAALNNDEVWLEVIYLSASGAPLGTLITSAKASFLAAAAAVTTSSATWTTTGMSNPNKQKLQVTFTPQLKGFIHATVKLCKASATVYVDPCLQISGVTSSAQRQIPGGMFVNELSSGSSGMLFIPDMAGV